MPQTPRETVTGRYCKEVKKENGKKYPQDLETQRLLPVSRGSLSVGEESSYIGRGENGF